MILAKALATNVVSATKRGCKKSGKGKSARTEQVAGNKKGAVAAPFDGMLRNVLICLLAAARSLHFYNELKGLQTD